MAPKTTDPRKPGNVVARAPFTTPQDGTVLARIGRASVGQLRVHLGGENVSHGTAFVYKQAVNAKSNTSTLYLITNRHVVTGILGLYPAFLDILSRSQKLSDVTAGLNFTLGENTYSISTVLTPRGEFFKDDASRSVHLDFAFFQITIDSAEQLEFFAVPDTWDTQQGSSVFALGYPEDMDLSIIDGIIGHIYNDTPTVPEHKWGIQHNIAIEPGCSGGPTITPFGHVIGIVTFGKWIEIKFSLNLQYILEYCKDPALLEEVLVEKVVTRLKNRAQEAFTYGT